MCFGGMGFESSVDSIFFVSGIRLSGNPLVILAAFECEGPVLNTPTLLRKCNPLNLLEARPGDTNSTI